MPTLGTSDPLPLPTHAPASPFTGGGRMGERMRAFAWDETPLGAPDRWPASLRSALSICLGSSFPIALYWGPALVLLYNDAWSPILGSKHPWALGRPGQEVWPEIWETVGPQFAQVLATGESFFNENGLLLMHRHGYTEECYFDFSFSPVRGERGQVDGVFNAVVETTFRVLTERRGRVLGQLAERMGPARSAEEACALAAQSLSEAQHDVPFCALYLVDDAGRAARLASTAGIAPGSAAAPAIVSLADGEEAAWPFAQAQRTGRVESVAELARRFEQTFPGGAWPEPAHTALVAPIGTGSAGTCAGFLVLGASARRAVDEEYRHFAAQAAGHVAQAVASATAYEQARRRAEELAALDRAKSAFFSNVSHEFRTPLTLLLGPTEEALARPERALKGEALELVHRNELRLLKLVNTLLDFSRIEAGREEAQLEPTDLAALTSDLASSFRSAIERGGLQFEVDCPPLPAPVAVDRTMWEKIVLNLLSNAFKFTLEGRVRVALRQAGDNVVLQVADTGVGIPAAELPRVFERFHRVEGRPARTFEGSGIGLALVHELVRLHEGTIEAASEEGQGTTFTVTLPARAAARPAADKARRRTSSTGAEAFVAEALRWLPDAPDASAEADEAPSPALPVPLRPARVLVCDDNADMRAYIARLLRPHWTVEEAADGQEALARARENPPDLVLTDVMMPVLDGFGLLRALKGEPATQGVPVIMLSARAGETASVEGLQAGADDYLVKPFAPRELVARVATHLELSRLRRRAEAERNRFQSLLREVPAIVNFLRGPDLVFDFAHPMAVEAVGGRPLQGRPLLEAIPENREQEIVANLLHVFRTGEPLGGREKLLRLDRQGTGELEDTWWNFTYLPVRTPDGEIEGVMTFDIEVTDQVQARRRIEGLMEALQEADRRKDEFLAMLAHELRNPMAAISMALGMLERPGLDQERAARHREMARRQMGNLVRLVDDLLDVSRITRGKVELRLESVDLGAVLQQALAANRPVIEARSHALAVQVGPGAFRLQADATRLEQVITNLLTNAAKYTEPGGRIEVRLEREVVQGSPTALLRVRDSGRGIPQPMLEKVFDTFVQVSTTIDRSAGGLGLGLTLVRRLVEMHGGSVRAFSEGPGQGSEFVVRLPLQSELAPQPAPSAASEPLRAPESRRILVVEDSDDVRETLQELLEELGHQVTSATNGPQGVERILAQLPDLAFVDVGLPGLDGFEVARRVRAAPGGAGPFLVALTGYGGPEAKSAAEQAGFNLHLTKPVDLDALQAVVRQAAQRR